VTAFWKVLRVRSSGTQALTNTFPIANGLFPLDTARSGSYSKNVCGSRANYTTAWGLLHHGFGYLSDELAPIDITSLHVHPYPRALCLKEVPIGFPPQAGAVDLGLTTHIPPPSLPGAPVYESKPLSAIFLLWRMPAFGPPEIRALAPAEAAARLYVHALNPLAHGNRGLDAVTEIATHVPCFAMMLAELHASCAQIQATVAETVAATAKNGDVRGLRRSRLDRQKATP
jgi:hypothetical protein